MTLPYYNGGMVNYGSYMEYKKDEITGMYYPYENGTLLYSSTDGIKSIRNGAYDKDTGYLTLTLSEKAKDEDGDHVSVCYTMDDFFGFYFDAGSDVRLENISIYHAEGMAIGSASVHNMYLNRVRLTPRNPEDLVTATADGLHCYYCTGEIKITNCIFTNSHDDSMNIKCGYGIVMSNQPKKIIYDSKAIIPFEVGDKIELYSTANFAMAGTYTITAVDKVNFTLTVAERITGDLSGYLIANVTQSPSLTIHDTLFGYKRNRGILVQCRDVDISGCTFTHIVHAGIQALSVYDSFGEGIIPGNVNISDNKFIHNGCTDINVMTWGKSGTAVGSIRNITINNNFFGESLSNPVYLLGVSDARVTHNLIHSPALNAVAASNLCIVNMASCDLITISDNCILNAGKRIKFISKRSIVNRNVAFVKREATIVSETQVCNFKCTVCK